MWCRTGRTGRSSTAPSEPFVACCEVSDSSKETPVSDLPSAKFSLASFIIVRNTPSRSIDQSINIPKL